MNDASGVTTYTYDNRDRVISRQTPQGTLTYTYDEGGNLLTTRSSNVNGTSIDYTYDVMNRLATVKDNFLPAGANSTGYSYDRVGNLQSYTYPNGVVITHTFNSTNRLTAMTISAGTTSLAAFNYTLGSTGNRTAVTEMTGRTVNYTYDDLYRLSSESIGNDPHGQNGSVNYAYDLVGNRLSRGSSLNPVPAQNLTYDSNDRLTSESYDNNGNTIASNGNNFTYDFENRLTSMNGGLVSFVYDGDGNRVARTVNGVTVRYLVDTNNLTRRTQVVEEISSGQVIRTYTYGHNLISQKQIVNNQWLVSFYGYDGQGSVRLLTDSLGNVTDTYTYDAFGILLKAVGNTPNEHLYAGEQLDPNTNFYYLRARYMNPSNGRFLTMDSYEGVNNDPKSLHKYLYVAGDAVNRIDPTGHMSSIAEAAGVSVMSAITAAMSSLMALVVAAAIVCTLDFAVTGTLNEAGLPIGGRTPCDARNRENRVYRGTSIVAENLAYDETGWLLSEAGRTGFFETGSIALAMAAGFEVHQQWNTLWGSELIHAQMHGALGVEMGRLYGMDRSFVSVTTDAQMARFFAGPNGRVYSAVVPRWEMVPQAFRGAGEGEWLIRVGRPGFSVSK